MFQNKSRRWVYRLLAVSVGLWVAAMLSLGSLFFNYERVFTAAHHEEHLLPPNVETVHWGYFSQTIEPKLVVDSGDTVTVETLTHHTKDDIRHVGG